MALKKVTSKKSLSIVNTEEDILSTAREYDEVSKHIKILEATKKTLADKLKNFADANGVKDDNGSYYLDLSDFIVGKVAKKSMSLNPERTKALLKEKGLTSKCLKVVEQIDESAIEKEVSSGNISISELESITDTKVTYSVSVKPKEELPDVDISSFAAARKK